jgi:hypothetical protein
MALIDTQQTMDAYIHDLINRGDYSRHYSDDVVVEVRGTEQRYWGREAAKNWVEGRSRCATRSWARRTRSLRPSSSVRMESRCPTR